MAKIGAAPVFKMTRQVPPLNLGSDATGGHKRPLQPIDLVRQGDLARTIDIPLVSPRIITLPVETAPANHPHPRRSVC